MAPAIPRKSKIFLLLPHTDIFCALRIERLKINDTTDLKNTISITGIFGTNFTHKFIVANIVVEYNMNRTPGVIIATNTDHLKGHDKGKTTTRFTYLTKMIIFNLRINFNNASENKSTSA